MKDHPSSLVIDSDVFIDALRGAPQARSYLQDVADQNLMISVMSCVELWAGAKGRDQEAALDDILRAVTMIEVDHEIAERASEISYHYARSHGVGAVDAVIAATAEIQGALLVTLNKKHFPMLKRVVVPYRKH